MSSNLKTIKWTGISCAISAVITYLICLNIAYGWFNITWLSNTFLLTIFGGIFASALVVLICEIQKYLMNKRSFEDLLWANTSMLYARLNVMKFQVDNIIKSPNVKVDKGLLDQSSWIALQIVNSAYTVDYATFYKKQKLYLSLKQFQSTKAEITDTLEKASYFNIAFIQDKIEAIEATNNPNPLITGSSANISKTVQILSHRFDEAIKKIEVFLSEIDYSGRYNWNKCKKAIKASYSTMRDFDFEEFLRKG